MAVRFDYNRRGGLTLNRDSLHESDGYKRQVEALKQLSDGEAVMVEKMTLRDVLDGVLVHVDGIAPYAEVPVVDLQAWADTLTAHLTQPAQAVDVLSAEDFAVLLRLRNALPDVGLNGWHRGVAVLNKLLTAALSNANGKEG